MRGGDMWMDGRTYGDGETANHQSHGTVLILIKDQNSGVPGLTLNTVIDFIIRETCCGMSWRMFLSLILFSRAQMLAR